MSTTHQTQARTAAPSPFFIAAIVITVLLATVAVLAVVTGA